MTNDLTGLPGWARDELTTLRREHRDVSARVLALESDLANARRERDALRAELTPCREERDRLTLRLLDTEVALAVARMAEGSQRAAEAESRATELARELAAIRQTLSWRVTRPLRAVRSRTRR